jgi:lysophospholipase L1-like esterase
MDSKGNVLTPKVVNNGGFNSNILGTYSVQYEAENSSGQKAACTRKVTVKYFGLSKEDLTAKTVSAYTGWSFKGADINPDRAKFMGDWNKYIVPSGHSANWNLFEDGGFCINMRGSDTEGRSNTTAEVEDDLPNTMLWNRVHVPLSMNTITLNVSCPLFPDYNNINARVKLTAIDMQTFEVIPLQDWTETKTPDPNTCFTINASPITGKDVVLLIEQDSAKDVIQTAPTVVETRDGLFVYGISMGYTANNLFNKSTVVNGSYISYINGILNSNAEYCTSDYIPVNPNAIYTINWFDQVAWFDSNNTFLSGVDGYQAESKTITAPANAAYLRVSIRLAKIDVYQLYEVRSVKSIMNNILHSAVKTHIKLLGDSITMGVGGTGFIKDGEVIVNPGWAIWNANTKGYCWANLLKTQVETNYNCSVKNWGTDGVDSAFILAQINAGNLIESDDELIILMIGTNDRLNYSGSGSAEILYQNLCAIVDKVHSMNKEIILMSSIPTSDANENSVTEPKIFHMSDVDKAVCRAASSKGAEYISLYQQMNSYVAEKGVTIDSLLSDGLHPNDTGYQVIADMIYAALGC